MIAGLLPKGGGLPTTIRCLGGWAGYLRVRVRSWQSYRLWQASTGCVTRPCTSRAQPDPKGWQSPVCATSWVQTCHQTSPRRTDGDRATTTLRGSKPSFVLLVTLSVRHAGRALSCFHCYRVVRGSVGRGPRCLCAAAAIPPGTPHLGAARPTRC